MLPVRRGGNLADSVDGKRRRPSKPAMIHKGNGVIWFFGDGTFIQAPNSPFPVGKGPSSIDAADFNGDGPFDLVVSNGAEN